MRRNRRRSERLARATDAPGLEMTPMIDVTFLLLVFFLCTLRFKTLEGILGAYLPKDVGPSPSEARPVEDVELRLDVLEPGARVRPDGSAYTPDDAAARRRFEYDATRVLELRLGTLRTSDLEAVQRYARRLHEAAPEAPAKVDARAGVTQGEVVRALDMLRDAGFSEVRFVGAYDE